MIKKKERFLLHLNFLLLRHTPLVMRSRKVSLFTRLTNDKRTKADQHCIIFFLFIEKKNSLSRSIQLIEFSENRVWTSSYKLFGPKSKWNNEKRHSDTTNPKKGENKINIRTDEKLFVCFQVVNRSVCVDIKVSSGWNQFVSI